MDETDFITEPEPKKKNLGGRPVGTYDIDIDYEKVQYLAKRMVPPTIIARKCGITSDGFYKRLRKDKNLKDAMEGAYDDGRTGIYVAQYRKAMEHYMTICKDCGKIADGQFLENCPFCESEHVRHKHIPADTHMLIHLGKHHLGQTDAKLLTIQGNRDKPIYEVDMSEAEIDKRVARLMKIIQDGEETDD